MQFDVKLLEAFRAVMETRSMTGAAKMLGLTQPAVSAQIARLETLLGFELFDRSGGRLQVSGKGRRFYEEALNAMSSLERLAQVAGSIRDGSGEAITVACHPSASIALMPRVTAALLQKRPDARLHTINRTSEGVHEIFETGIANIAVAEWPLGAFAQTVVKRYDVECVVVAPLQHSLEGMDVVRPVDLVGEPFIAMSDMRATGFATREVFGEAGLEFSPTVVSEYFSTICHMVALGCGVAIVDRWSADAFAPFGLTIRPFVPEIRYKIALFHRSAPPLTPREEEVAALLDQTIRELGGVEAG